MHFQTLANLVVSGASGFVGHAVAQAADAAVAAGRLGGVRRMVRDPGKLPVGEAAVLGDLTDARSLVGALRGARLLVHAAGYRGSDPVLQQRVNIEGTRAIVEAAIDAGMERIVSVSTTAVYGSGAHRGEAEGLAPHPESSLSESRLAAEEIVLAADGFVVRADLTFGAGDNWVVPGLVRIQRMLGGAVDGGAALTSAIAVSDLGRLLVALAVAEGEPSERVFHAAAHPVPLSALIDAVADAVGIRVPAGHVLRADALPVLLDAGYTAHQVDLITSDHWYDGSALRRVTGLQLPVLPSIDRLASEWYSRILNDDRSV
jgi:nucleoside-diphosphate-sugar epimerase